MHISNVSISGFRNFMNIDIPLSKNTMILGVNDVGKTNLLDAINLVLYDNKPGFHSKRLSEYDFNSSLINLYNDSLNSLAAIIRNREADYKNKILGVTPKIEITLTFSVDKDDFVGLALLNKFIYDDSNEVTYKLKYEFSISNTKDYINYICNIVDQTDEDIIKINIPIKYYDYKIYSPFNEYEADIKILKKLRSSIIYANRDSFSTDENLSSTNMISKIISEEMNETEKSQLIDAYKSFFEKIKEFKSFKDVFSYIEENEIKNVSAFIKNINLIPNAKKYQNVLSNISISYGNEMLFQKGLGTRNLIFIFTLFSYLIKSNDDTFNLLAIEEPESHLSVDNYKLVLDYVTKTIENNNSKNQLLLTSHSNQFINKLDLTSITVLCSNDKAINLGELDIELQFYISKRSNFDILKLLLAKNVILVEGITEELYINTLLEKNKTINDINVISIGQTGFTKFMDIWLKLHKGDEDYRLGVVKDFDNRETSKEKHLNYSKLYKNIFVAITENYTFENDFVKNGNLVNLNNFFGEELNEGEMVSKLKEDKADSILKICMALRDGYNFSIPNYIAKLIGWFTNEDN